MNRILILLTGFFLIAVNCFAMKLEQPVEIGKVSFTPPGYFEIVGATSHNGTPFPQEYIKSSHLDTRKVQPIYNRGFAIFGSGSDAICLYYDSGEYRPTAGKNRIYAKFGDKNINNTIETGAGIPTHINLIKTDSGITFYLLLNIDESGLVGRTHTLLGKRSDGVFVKYFNTYDLKRQYFGRARDIFFSDYRIEGDTIIIGYQRRDSANSRFVDAGEFRFKWDESAQWFGIEQVIF